MWNDYWSIMKPVYLIIWFSFNNNVRFSIKWYSRAQQVIKHKFVKYTCSMETVQQNGRFTLFSNKFLSIHSFSMVIIQVYNFKYSPLGSVWTSLTMKSTQCAWHWQTFMLFFFLYIFFNFKPIRIEFILTMYCSQWFFFLFKKFSI